MREQDRAVRVWEGPGWIFPPSSGRPQLVEALEVQPKFCTRAKKMSEAQGSVARDSPCSVQNLRNPTGRNVDLTCQLSRAHIKRFELLGQVFRPDG